MVDKLRVMFVDDEPRVLHGLRRMLRPLRDEWEMRFVGRSDEALRIIEEQSFDVIVSDMRMPHMDGAALLSEVESRRPSMIRIILSGQSEREMVLRSVGPAHQYLAKPCDSETIRSTITRAHGLRTVLSSEALVSLVSRLESVPALPSMYQELVAELRSPQGSLEKVGTIIARDLGMSAKVLQLVSSAFFGVRQRVTSPHRAAVMLGAETIRALVLSAGVFTQFEGASPPGMSLNRLRSHSVTVGSFARHICRLQGCDKATTEDALIAGLLHDLGKLVLAANLPDDYQQVRRVVAQRQIPLSEAEQEVFGGTHAEVGAYLLGLWGLSDPVVESIAYHHRPGERTADGFTALTAVHVADALEHELGSEPAKPPVVDECCLSGLGGVEQLESWRQACLELLAKETKQ